MYSRVPYAPCPDPGRSRTAAVTPPHRLRHDTVTPARHGSLPTAGVGWCRPAVVEVAVFLVCGRGCSTVPTIDVRAGSGARQAEPDAATRGEGIMTRINITRH